MSSAIPRNRGSASGPGTRCRRSRRSTLSVSTALGQLALVGVVAGSAWLFGGVQASVQVGLFVGGVVALLCLLVKQLADQDAATSVPATIVPLVLLIGWGGLQLIPTAPDVAAFLSPDGARLRGALQSETTASDAALATTLGLGEVDQRQPLSVYPASTRRDLALLSLATGVFLAGAGLFGTPAAALWLCGLVAVNGAAIAFFGLVQKLTWDGLLFWTVPLTQGGAPFASFVNRNNGGGYLNLCLACALGLLVWVTRRSAAGSAAETAIGRQSKGRPWARAWQWLLEGASNLDAPTIAAASLTACIAAGILCSLSRGAIVAMTGAASVLLLTLVFARRRRSVRLWWVAVAGAGGLALVCWVGMQGSIVTRLATLLDRETIVQNRIPHWRDGLKAAADFRRTGSGLGTYRYVYGPYQQQRSTVWYYHAENQYLETLVESGVVGLGLTLLAIAFVATAGWQLLRSDSDAKSYALGVAGVFALSSQAIHAFFDFGLYIPANLLLLALLCGALSGRAAQLARRVGSLRILALPGGRRLWTTMAAVFLAVNVWGLVETRRVEAVETSIKQSRFAETPDAVAPEELEAAIQEVETAARSRADDAEAHVHLARLWTHLYRLHALERLRASATSEEKEGELWERTAPMGIHELAHHFRQFGHASKLVALRSEALVQDCLIPALRHLVLARRACPVLPEVHARIAELSVIGADPKDDQIHIDRAKWLAAAHPEILFRCGLLEFQAGRPDLAYESWRRSLSLSHRYLDRVLDYAGRRISFWHLVHAVLPESPELLLRLARDRYSDEEHAAVRRMLVERAEELLEKKNLPEDERSHLQGVAFALKGEVRKAIESYYRAVEIRRERNDWRFDLALGLKEAGRMDEAHEQAKLCARMDPDNREYRKLLAEINHTRLTEKPVLE